MYNNATFGRGRMGCPRRLRAFKGRREAYKGGTETAVETGATAREDILAPAMSLPQIQDENNVSNQPTINHLIVKIQ